MKKQNNSARASSLQITFSVALICALASLMASSSKAASASALDAAQNPQITSPRESAASATDSMNARSETALSRSGPLSFDDRVAYQRAVEEVHWRHRIWPKENQGTKPSFDEVMPQAAIEKKVEDYLRNSQLLEQYWQKPITPEQLQVEMDRMATHTKQPEVLREIFAALGSDPTVIAECLARPALAERLVSDQRAQEDSLKRDVNAQKPDVIPPVPRLFAAKKAAHYTLSPITAPSTACVDNWTLVGSGGVVAGRAGHTAIWTGSEMIVWGGHDHQFVPPAGGRYDPSTDSWSTTTTDNAPSVPRSTHTAVWTGTEMIIWGGGDATGARYNPMTDSWTATAATNAPVGRSNHTAAGRAAR